MTEERVCDVLWSSSNNVILAFAEEENFAGLWDTCSSLSGFTVGVLCFSLAFLSLQNAIVCTPLDVVCKSDEWLMLKRWLIFYNFDGLVREISITEGSFFMSPVYMSLFLLRTF